MIIKINLLIRKCHNHFPLRPATHWSWSNVELEKITQANNLYGCLGIGLRYSEILNSNLKMAAFQIKITLDFYFMKKLGQ